MAGLLDQASAVVGSYGGTVDKLTGDGVMAVFGAPIALEDHAVRACRVEPISTKINRGTDSRYSRLLPVTWSFADGPLSPNMSSNHPQNGVMNDADRQFIKCTNRRYRHLATPPKVGGPEGLVVPVGTGIVLAVARGDIAMSKWIERGANKRSYIVRSDEDFNTPQIGRQLLWLVDICPE